MEQDAVGSGAGWHKKVRFHWLRHSISCGEYYWSKDILLEEKCLTWTVRTVWRSSRAIFGAIRRISQRLLKRVGLPCYGVLFPPTVAAPWGFRRIVSIWQATVRLSRLVTYHIPKAAEVFDSNLIWYIQQDGAAIHRSEYTNEWFAKKVIQSCNSLPSPLIWIS